MKKTILILTVLFMAFQQSGCSQSNPQEKNQVKSQNQVKENPQDKPRENSGSETLVLIKTSFGDITAKLYNDTPNHRDNFIKMIKEGWYDDSPFHRIIKGFMIQGGGNKDGRQDPGYTIPAEILPNHLHKKGALAAARQGDQVNPQKASSGCQFYIVQGTVLTEDVLNSYEQRNKTTFGPEQRKTYTTTGGAPWLDGGYTVFGEVVSGFDVIDKIAAVPVGPGDKPVNNVTMKIEILE
jgi:cyclophilin family peptidyl-prolyl cis-trans isomerase